MTEFTPGPWEWMIHDHSMASLYGPYMEFSQVMAISPCSACARNVDEWKWGRCQTPNEANSSLIAAAPELLGALRGLLERYVQLASSGDCGFWNPEEEQEVINARAAIAKALGQAEAGV